MLDLQYLLPDNYLVHCNLLEYYNSTCIVAVSVALHVFSYDTFRAKPLSIPVISLRGSREDGADIEYHTSTGHLTDLDVDL